jgi:hypothetical protein
MTPWGRKIEHSKGGRGCRSASAASRSFRLGGSYGPDRPNLTARANFFPNFFVSSTAAHLETQVGTVYKVKSKVHFMLQNILHQPQEEARL